MPMTIHCCHCGGMLQLHDEDAGKKIQCPMCSRAFTVHFGDETTSPAPSMPNLELSSDNAPLSRFHPSMEAEQSSSIVKLDAERLAPPPNSDPKHGARRSPRSVPGEEDDSAVSPHRGSLVLTLGILSLVFAWCPIAGWILSSHAMRIGSHDIEAMRKGTRDRYDNGMTQSGRILGHIGAIVSSFVAIFLGWMLFMYLTSK